ncbi:MAG: hypothetical protein HY222_04810 [Thaumarchaeota archaeon]|nr:hypothetical protein [Nitrososphaerota archaeon]MBI3641695.1 hypothetical protein [Nitrososphaerota archaeon]
MKNNNTVKRTRVNRRKIDPHHCRCFSIPKSHFRYFEAKIMSLGYSDPFFEEDHGQILGFTKRLSEYYQIHVKLMRTGRIESEIEYPQDYPVAHLNSTHSFSAHPELHLLLIAMQIPYKRKRTPPVTCIQRQVIPAQTPTHMDAFLKVSGGIALLDLIFNDGEITGKALDVLSKQVSKSITRKIKRRKYL